VGSVYVRGISGVPFFKRLDVPDEVPLTAASVGFPNTSSPQWVAMHPSGRLAVIAHLYTTGGAAACLLVFIDPRTGIQRGCKRIYVADGDTTLTIPGVFTTSALIVARGQAVYRIALVAFGDSLIPADIETVTPAASTLTGNAPARERIVALAARPDGDDWLIWAAFNGATAAGTFANPTGSIASGTCARHVRAGVALIRERAGELAWEVIGDAPSVADPYVEIDAGGLAVSPQAVRLSYSLARSPRGGLPSAIAADVASGAGSAGFVVAFTNDGWGPTTAFTPDGTRAATCLAKYDREGRLVWEIDLSSRIGGEAGGKRAGIATTYPCDVPDEDGANVGTTSANGPAIRALAVDPEGVIYAAGRISAGRYNVWCIDAGGTVRWRARTESNNPTSGSPAWASPGAAGGGTPRYGLAIDPADQAPLVIGRRNNTHGENDTPLDRFAWLFKLQPADGSITWAWAPSHDDTDNQGTGVAASANQVVVGMTTWSDS
jgi:hypothetical protein